MNQEKRDPGKRIHKTRSVTLTDEAWALLYVLAVENGTTRSGIIERLAREAGKQEAGST